MSAGGYMQRILMVDLTSREVSVRDMDERLAMGFIGGTGLGTAMLSEAGGADADPLGSENPLIFAVGPLTGTRLFNSDRFGVVSRSPLTGVYGEASAGGFWGGKFKRCGYDALVITGQSEAAVYIYLDSEGARIRDASHLWGKDTFQTIDLLKAEYGAEVKAASIGPAGENQVRIANLITDGYHGRALGRCGFGAVMGSKRLKAVVVNGSLQIPVAAPDRLAALQKRLGPMMRENPKALRDGGTSVGLEFCEEIGNLPIRNWSQGSWPEGARKLTGMTMVKTLLAARYHCGSCVINCGRIVKASGGPYAGMEIAGPEYETLGLLGSNLLIDDLATVVKANELCNRYGLDTISTGSVIGFAMEAWARGLIGPSDTEGIALTWGNGESALAMIERIASRGGFGAVLEGGVRRAAQHIGRGSEAFALEVKGLEPPAHDPRSRMTVALGLATASRGACHLGGFTHDFEEGAVLTDLGLPPLTDRFSTCGKAENVVRMQHLMCMFDSLVCCKFGLFGGLTVDPLIEALNCVTGWEYDRDRFFLTGERIFNLKRLCDNRWGVTARDDRLPARMRYEPKGGGTRDSLPPLEPMLEEYYRIRGWDALGRPAPEKLRQLGLSATG